MTFQIGDKVIYPNHGLGVVQGIETKTILGTTCGFYHLKMVANETTVLVPVDNVDGVGLRRAIGDEEIDRLFTLLGDGKIDNHQNWKGRFKDNSTDATRLHLRCGRSAQSLTFLARSRTLVARSACWIVLNPGLSKSRSGHEKTPERGQGRSRARRCFTMKTGRSRGQGRQGASAADHGSRPSHACKVLTSSSRNPVAISAGAEGPHFFARARTTALRSILTTLRWALMCWIGPPAVLMPLSSATPRSSTLRRVRRQALAAGAASATT